MPGDGKMEYPIVMVTLGSQKSIRCQKRGAGRLGVPGEGEVVGMEGIKMLEGGVMGELGCQEVICQKMGCW